MAIGKYLQKNGGIFVSFFAVAAFLPVLLVGVTSPGSLKLLTHADAAEVLRMWIEPETAIVKLGEEVDLKVMAEYDDARQMIPRLETGLRADSMLGLVTEKVVYDKPFSGRVTVGLVHLVPQTRGSFDIAIVEGSVNTTLPNVDVVTQVAKLTVQ
jgi:hypothetical protein